MLVSLENESGTICKASGLIERSQDMPVVQSVYMASSYVDLSITKVGNATVDAGVVGKIGKTTKISLTVEIQKYSKSKKTWSSVKSWTESNEGSLMLSLSKQYSLSDRGRYRVKLTSKVWNGNDYEKGTVFSSTKEF